MLRPLFTPNLKQRLIRRHRFFFDALSVCSIIPPRRCADPPSCRQPGGVDQGARYLNGMAVVAAVKAGEFLKEGAR
jgi:hypothetical protein